MKELTKYYLLLFVLLVLAVSLMAYLLYDNGLTADTLRSMSEGLDLNEMKADNARRVGTIDKLKPLKEALLDTASYAIDHRYPPQTEEGARRGLSVLMYHKVYDPMDLTFNQRLNDNYISTDTLEEELKYLTDEGYSFPDWKAVRRYIDGEIDLPEKSVVLTFDDGTDGFRKNGIPLLKKYNVPATAFIIVSRNGDKWVADRDEYPDIDLESHSYDMHRPGGSIGHGGIMTALTYDQILSDLKMSQEILGSSNAFAYPFGDVDMIGNCRTAVEDSGFLVAFTTKYGKVYPGADPYLLPRMRVLRRNSLEAFKTLL